MMDSISTAIHYDTLTKSSPIVSKKRKWKKPKDKPKRPLSAYNIFFQRERQKLVTAPLFSDTPSRQRRDGTPLHGKISFEDLARQVGYKWKTLDERTRKIFEAEAQTEKERYAMELEAWNEMQPPAGKKSNSKGRSYKKLKLMDQVRKTSRTISTETPKPLSPPQLVTSYDEDRNVAMDGIPKEINIHIPNHQEDASDRRQPRARSPGSLLFSLPAPTRDPYFDPTAHRECLELTRKTIENAKAALNEASSPQNTCFKIQPHYTNKHVDMPSTPDIIDSNFWDEHEDHVILRHDFLATPRVSLGSFSDKVDDSF